MAATETYVRVSDNRWPMAIRGFLCQNVTVGCAFGGYGLTVLPLQETFGTSRGVATLGMALAVLTMGLACPFVATLIGRIGLRVTMLCGAFLSGAGYLLLAMAPNIAVVLAAYALLIGLGLAMCGPFSASMLVSKWFRGNPGPALGFVNMSFAIVFIPFAGVAIIASQGLTGFYLAMAALCFLLLPIALGVAEPADSAGSTAGGAHGAVAAGGMSAAEVLRRPIFWATVIGGGIMNAGGITGMSHLVAFAVEKGLPAEKAALLLSVIGVATVIGSLLIGILSGRLGGARALALIGLGMAFGWSALLMTSSLTPMAIATLGTGICSSGIFPAVNVFFAQLFGPASLARAVGLYALLSLLLSFCLPPLAGVLHDAASSYTPVALIIIGGCAVAGLAFLLVAKLVAGQPSQAVASA